MGFNRLVCLLIFVVLEYIFHCIIFRHNSRRYFTCHQPGIRVQPLVSWLYCNSRINMPPIIILWNGLPRIERRRRCVWRNNFSTICIIYLRLFNLRLSQALLRNRFLQSFARVTGIDFLWWPRWLSVKHWSGVCLSVCLPVASQQPGYSEWLTSGSTWRGQRTFRPLYIRGPMYNRFTYYRGVTLFETDVTYVAQ